MGRVPCPSLRSNADVEHRRGRQGERRRGRSANAGGKNAGGDGGCDSCVFTTTYAAFRLHLDLLNAIHLRGFRKYQNRRMVMAQVLVDVPRCAIVTPLARPGGPLGLFWWLPTPGLRQCDDSSHQSDRQSPARITVRATAWKCLTLFPLSGHLRLHPAAGPTARPRPRGPRGGCPGPRPGPWARGGRCRAGGVRRSDLRRQVRAAARFVVASPAVAPDEDETQGETERPAQTTPPGFSDGDVVPIDRAGFQGGICRV